MESVLNWVSQYGYTAIFLLLMFGIVGLPVPDEWLLTFTGYLVSQGRLHLAPALASAVLGSACGITLSYALGYSSGMFLVRKYGRWFHVTPERLDRVHRWFGRMGHWTLTFGYFVPGVRHLTAYVAGASRLELPSFALFAYAGAFIWAAVFIFIGRKFGEQAKHILEHMHQVGWVALGVGVVGGAVAYLWRRRAGRQG